MNFVWKTLATGFGSGYFPWFPGTIGSAVALFIAWYIPLQTWQIVVLCLLGIPICTKGEELFSKHDCSNIVFDEFCGIFIATWHLTTFTEFIVAFVLFRMLDILKPFPINKLQELPRGIGVMIDDMVAGLVARYILYLLIIARGTII